jgi:hypothetical protein
MKIYFFLTLFLVFMSIFFTNYFKLAKLEFFMKQKGQPIIEKRKNNNCRQQSTRDKRKNKKEKKSRMEKRAGSHTSIRRATAGGCSLCYGI